MSRITKITMSFATALMLFNSITANAVLNMGGQTIFAGAVIEVVEPGPNLQAIIDGISDASATKPYLIKLGPGVYDLGFNNIVMKAWVSIHGSGQESTTITGTMSSGLIDATSATVAGVNNASLMDLTIINTGIGTVSMAIFNNAASPRIERVTATASGGIQNYGIRNDSSSPIMTDVTASASGGAENYGVYNTSSSPTMANITATASAGNSTGVFNTTSSSPIMINVTATASGDNNVGVSNLVFSSPFMTKVIARASSGSSSIAVVNDQSSPHIQDSILEGAIRSLSINSSSTGTRVVNSKLVGSVLDSAAGTQCRGNYDGNLAAVTC